MSRFSRLAFRSSVFLSATVAIGVSSTQFVFHQRNVFARDSKSKTAILAVGAVGTGKSGVIGLLSGQPVDSRGGAQSVTSKTSFYAGKNGDVYVDTKGWMDTFRQESDYDITRDIAQALQDEEVERVKILWCCNPDIRSTEQLQKEAEFINRLKDKAIWDSVLILEKKPRTTSLSDGVKEAARKNKCVWFDDGGATDHRHGHYLGLYILDWIGNPQEKANVKLLRSDANPYVMTAEDAKAKLMTKLDALSPTRMVYIQQTCTKCFARFDKRFPPAKCHQNVEDSNHDHTDATYQGNTSAEYGVEGLITGGYIGLTLAGFIGAIKGAIAGTLIGLVAGLFIKADRYECCYQRKGDAVPRRWKSYRCKRVCSHCHKNMRTEKGCGLVDIFPHDIVAISQ
mmetsp:Transcript_33935/g.54369  ORF Transcript_33935/g.54369 Transcript_33935/m.54369 type:complete len:397 (-) Transcript_33935:156-1346(-)